MRTPIHDFLKSYADSGTLRLHMPGGKGSPYPRDITEISGADVLYESSGIIRESEDCAAALFGAAASCYSCGGSTLAIQAMLAAASAATGKRRIAAGRCSHRSLVSAAVLLGLDIDWIYPDEFPSGTVSPEQVEAALTPGTAAVFVTSVDYLGGECDIAGISDVCRRHGVLLLADNAHGAYKVFTGDHPITLGADMTADSAHKTLPALTGAAYVHLADAAFREPVKSAMALFGSSSPSYLILESLDLCNRFIAEEREAALAALNGVSELKKALTAEGIPLRQSDAARIVIDANALGYTGAEYAELMRKAGAECEMGGVRSTVLLFSAAQQAGDFGRTAEIIKSLPRKKPIEPPDIPVIVPERVMPPREAYLSPSETVPVSRAAGRVCADIRSPCPPCVPIVMPGELISPEAAAVTERYGVTAVRVVK
ncbi:MAG: aminotransferase class V-fold PLP-dependent enzyme [Ruminiclostridium sp.]|nr:aminotransferase class V-fold PLP-dependent enzyme [Ruminiclostridium sp.]